MMRRLAVGMVCLLVLAGCGLPGFGNEGCTEIGADTGVGVSVGADVAPVRELRLVVCPDDGDCRTVAVQLFPGSSSVDEGCDGTGDDAQCSARVTEDATQTGFVQVGLSPGPVEVSGSYRQGGRTVELDQVTVEAQDVYPNGRDCGAAGTQAQATIDASGLR